MFRNLEEIRHYTLEATDGEIGRCDDFLFDDEDWVMRYMVADTRKWLPGRKVLVSPHTLQRPDKEMQSLPIMLTREQLKNAPGLEEHEPISRQYEEAYHEHFGYAFYWLGSEIWGTYPDAQGAIHPVPDFNPEPLATKDGHLRSVKEMIGYEVYASRGESVGTVHDFMADENTWAIRWLVLDTGHWLSGKKVFLASSWTRKIDWVNRCLWLDISKVSIEKSPEFDPDDAFTRNHETRLRDYYQLGIGNQS